MNSSLPAILGGEPIRPEGPPNWPIPDPQIEAVFSQLYASGNWGLYHGPECGLLADQLKTYFDCEHMQLCSSGSLGVELALRGCKVGPGDEVIMAAYDYKANFQDLVAIGATAVLVDVRADDAQLDVDQLESAIGEKTKAIICSHLHGGIVDMPRVMEIAGARDILVVEDACQATGGMVFGRKAGLWGDVGVISFGGSKLLTAGRGGAVFGNSAQIMQRIHLYEFRGNHTYPLAGMQAAVLIPQLAQLDARNRHRTAAVAHIVNGLAGDDLSQLAVTTDQSVSVYYKVGFRFAGGCGLTRELFCQAMRAEGIALDPGFQAIHKTHSRRRFRAIGELSNASVAGSNLVGLHHPVLLGEQSDWDQVVAAVRRIQSYSAEIAAAKM